MNIDDGLISYLEDLSNLTFSDAEKELLKDDLEKILNYMARLSELDLDDSGENPQAPDNMQSLRGDEKAPSFERALILQNAPNKNERAFIAPPTF